MNIEEEWKKAQAFEKNWWLTTPGWHHEEIRKGDIVGRMMLVDKGVPQKTVIDIGCGPFSLVQRVPVKDSVCLDPIFYDHLEAGYINRGIKRLYKCGEDLTPADGTFDEAWIYNCLQHVKDPQKIIENAMNVASVVRIFEWTYIPPYEGHLYELTPEMLSTPFKVKNWNVVMETRGLLNHSHLNGNYYMAIYSKAPAREFTL